MKLTYHSSQPNGFQSAGRLYDWYSGQELPSNFQGSILVGDSVFVTWIEQDERAWRFMRTY